MIYAKKQLTKGNFYNIYEIKLLNGTPHQERLCSFYDWKDIEDFFKGYAMINNKKVQKQTFISGKVILTIND